jgi:hypothetical protein
VPPDGSRFFRSLPYTIPTFLFGWWSLFGMFWTIGTLISNCAGGTDVTGDLLSATGGSADMGRQMVERDVQAKREQSRRAVRQFLAIVGVVAVLVLIGYFTFRLSPGSVAKPAIPATAVPAAAPVQAGAANAAFGQPTRVAKPSTAMVPVKQSTTRAPAEPVRVQNLILESIYYSANPNRRSVVVNGQSLMIGEEVGGYRLVGVNLKSATLVSRNGKEVTLNLPGS